MTSTGRIISNRQNRALQKKGSKRNVWNKSADKSHKFYLSYNELALKEKSLQERMHIDDKISNESQMELLIQFSVLILLGIIGCLFYVFMS